MTLTQINKAGLDEIALDHVFTIGASGSSAYTFQGEGLNGTVNNPTLYLTRGKTYRFENGSGGHPIRIQSTSGASGTAYNTGVTNNATAGTVIVEVQHDAPDILYYQCTSHPAMNGILYITGALADGGVTTAKLATDAVTQPKIAASAIHTENINDNAVSSAKIESNAITTAKIADDAVTTAKIGAGAVGTTELSNSAVTTNKIATGAVNAAKIADNAVTTSNIVDDAVTTAKIADDAITSAQMAANSVNTSELIDNAVTEAKIASGSVTQGKLASNSVTTNKIAGNAVTSAELAPSAVSNTEVHASAAIAGTKIAPNFGSQNIETTGNLTCDGEFQPHWIGHQSQCADNTYNTTNYWKVAEVTGGGSEGGKIEFFGTTDYSGLGHNQQAAKTTLVLRHLTNNQLAGIWWTESGGYTSITDIRWKYNGANNVYTIWVKSGAYSNVVPHITGSFDYAQTFGSDTGSSGIPTGSTPFENKFAIEMKGNVEPAININSEAIITYPTRPCFHGGNQANDSTGIVEYDAVHVNRGSHYSTANDRFICPVDGIYYVALFGMSHNSVSTMDIAIRKNGSDYNGCVPYSSGFTGQYHHVSGQALISCSENDYLQVHIGSGSFYGSGVGRHSGFTVFLVA